MTIRADNCTNHSASNYMAAYTSPVYIKCGDAKVFDGPAMEHMLTFVEGSTEYIKTIATNFDESSRKRRVKLYKEVQRELTSRLKVAIKRNTGNKFHMEK